MHLARRALLGVLAATVAPAVAGAQDVPADSQSVYVLPELDVTASVSGTGKTRAASTLDSTLLVRAVPAGTSALRVIERLPGVNVNSTDAFGVYEWSTRVTIRGFQSQQIGQTLDGVPLGDMSYGNFNGLSLARAIDASNLAATTVEQGSGALGTASANNLGGVIQYRSARPSDRRGVRVQQMVGAHNALRSFTRFDLGRVPLGGDAAVRGFVSVSNASNDKWKGGGERHSSFPGNRSLLWGQDGLFREADNWQDQINAKAELALGPARTVTAYYNYSDKKESDYMDLSLAVFRDPGLGPDTDYWTRWADAKRYAELSTAQYDPRTDVAYYQSAQGARQDHLGYLRADWSFGRVRAVLTPYFHTNRGGGDWHAPSYGAAYSPDPIMFRQTQYGIDRLGVTGRVVAEVAGNLVEAGLWLESNEVRIRRPRWGLLDYEAGPAVDFANVLRLDFDRTGEVGTRMLYLQNSNRFLDERLRLTYGVKYLHVDARFRSNGNTPVGGVRAPLAPDADRPELHLPTEGRFLPQVGAVLSLGAEEIFANFSENLNQYPYSPQGGVYNADPSLFGFLADADPERASTFDVGVRTRRGPVEGSLALYSIDYRNRLIGIAVCPPTVTCATGFGNVGSVTSRGAEGLVSVRLVPGLTWMSSASYNEAKFDDDFLARQGDPSTRVRTGGKYVQDSPRWLATSSLAYERGGVRADLTGRYVDRRFFTYTNGLESEDDGRGFVPTYRLVDAGVGYRFERLGRLHGVSLQLNVRNLFDARYIGTIGTNGFRNVGDNQTLQTGAGRMVFLTTGFDL